MADAGANRSSEFSAGNSGRTSLLRVTRPAMRFCWHLRAGICREVEHYRIRAYAEFFFRIYLDPHLQRQEQMLAGIEGLDAAVVKKARASQRKLRMLFQDTDDMDRFVGLVEDKLEEHVRFGQKILLAELQTKLPGHLFNCLYNIELVNDSEACRRLVLWEDRFWELR
jgi:hypothetical protein